MEFALADGLDAIRDKGITDIAICGMGGELIASIIDASPHLRDGGVNLILGPMTRQETLRRYLFSSGFEILDEEYSKDGGKYYVTLLCRYTGTAQDISVEVAHLGIYARGASTEGKEPTAEAIGYFEKKRAALMRRVTGLGGSETEEKIIKAIDEIIFNK